MRRRRFLQSLLALGIAAGSQLETSQAQPSGLRITRVRFYQAPRPNPTFNQSNAIVTVETNEGITGIGEGGTAEMVEQNAAMLIGEDPLRTEHLWQMMYRGWFYPPGREKIHALGALDLALWDIRGKVLGAPCYTLLGGPTRDHIECYSTAFPDQGSLEETARACIEAGFRAFRMSVSGDDRTAFNSQRAISETHQACRRVAEAVKPDGDWVIDLHTRFDPPQAIRLCRRIEELEPYFVEDLIRSENKEIYEHVRNQVHVPIAVGEQFSDRWDIHRLIENHWIDYCRVTLPNAGGLTEFVKLAALCETHYVGLVPHFTGSVATAALAHACGSFSGPVLVEILGAAPDLQPHLPETYDFSQGKILLNQRPGLGVTFDPDQATLVAETTERNRPIPMLFRPDGSITNW